MEVQWFRSELKDRAKKCLKVYYWKAFLLTLVVGLLGGNSESSGSVSSSISSAQNIIRTQVNFGSGGAAGSTSGVDMTYNYASAFDHSAFLTAMLLTIMIGMLIAAVVTILFRTFVGNVVTVGGKRYYMESRAFMRNAGVGRAFWAFGEGRYWNVVKVMFLKNLFVSLWTLLLIVPGIIKAYQYYMVPYILAENPEMPYKQALQLSKEMMNGHKWNTFVLELSFLGWYLLGALCCGIGVFFVNPYTEATLAELYAVLRQNSVGYGLHGFGEPEVYADVVG